MPKYWFSSDLHFTHRNILFKFCPETRRGKDEFEMDELMIQNWQEQVAYGDVVWLLGDIFFCKYQRAKQIMQRLKAITPNINLVLGNHDQVIATFDPRGQIVPSNPDLFELFETVVHWRKLEIEGKTVIMHHFPTYEWDKMHRGAYHLYGHIHSRYSYLPHPGIGGRSMDVGVDSRGGDMKLWSWPEIDNILSKREIRGHHEKEL